MADTSSIVGWGFSESASGQDSLKVIYQVKYDSVPATPYVALSRARSASGSPVPPKRDQYLTTQSWMFAQAFDSDWDHADPSKEVLKWTVTYSPPPEGTPAEVYQYTNPLARPPVFDIRYMDIEEIIDKAKNVGALSHGNGSGGNRADGTEGPIVNAAGKQSDIPLMRSARQEVLVITKNYPNLAAIVTRNRTYKQTTNSDTPQGYGARELRYLLTESHGAQFESGVEFWPGTTTILAEKTTDLSIDNVGYDYWDPNATNPAGAPGNTDGYWAKAGAWVTDEEGNEIFEPAAEPVNLKLDGDIGGTTTTTITYRDLEPVAYAGLFT